MFTDLCLYAQVTWGMHALPWTIQENKLRGTFQWLKGTCEGVFQFWVQNRAALVLSWGCWKMTLRGRVLSSENEFSSLGPFRESIVQNVSSNGVLYIACCFVEDHFTKLLAFVSKKKKTAPLHLVISARLTSLPFLFLVISFSLIDSVSP